MTISEKDIKLLWGRAMGRCSYCNEDLTMNLETTDPIIIGEMAHVIARQNGGPRGSEKIEPSKRNSYGNIILLCLKHHKMIDDAPLEFTVDQILGWKKNHEERLAKLAKGSKFSNKKELFLEVQKILIKNHTIHQQLGPDSAVAQRNPTSNAEFLWEIRKLAQIIPNNKRIILLIEDNEELLVSEEINIFALFREHAIAFERNSYERIDKEGVPRFPIVFEEMIKKVLQNG